MSIKSVILSEMTAGGLWIEIYDDGELVYSHDYFADGCTGAGYTQRLKDAKDDAEAAENYSDYDGCDHDQDGSISKPSDALTTYEIAECVIDEKGSINWTIHSAKCSMDRDFLAQF